MPHTHDSTPFRHSFWIKATKGDELCRFFCADNKDEMLKIIAAIVKVKVSIINHVILGCDMTAVSQLSEDPCPS